MMGAILILESLTRAEVGELIGMHESTVSRATAEKYVMLPSGEVVPFSHFFTASLGVKDQIKRMIEAEDPRHPLSDQEIADALGEEGYALTLAARKVERLESAAAELDATAVAADVQSEDDCARLVDEQTHAKLKVRFAPAWLSWLPPVWGDYWIIGLAPDYSWAVVGDPGREYLWILARTPRLDPDVIALVDERLELLARELVDRLQHHEAAGALGDGGAEFSARERLRRVRRYR